MRPLKCSPEQVIAALQAKHGMVSLAARALGCSTKTVQRMIKRYRKVRTAWEEQRTQMLDVAESALLKAIANGNVAAITFYLKTLGRERGYVEHVRTTGFNVSLTADDLVKLSDDEIKALIAQLAAAESGAGAPESAAAASVAG